MTRILIHIDGNGTYQGNGGLIMLLELGSRLESMGYEVAYFDPADCLTPDKFNWTGHRKQTIIPWIAVLDCQDVIISTWLYGWLNVLNSHPELWPRLRYWCSGELLRDEPQHDPARAWIVEHKPEIAICNPTFDSYYMDLGIKRVHYWTNWVSDLFFIDDTKRIKHAIGFQPDKHSEDILWELHARYDCYCPVIDCRGTHPEVARLMQQCDIFLTWNNLWDMIPGPGESFGLSQYEAMMSGCATVGRRHCANHVLEGIMPMYDQLDQALGIVDQFIINPQFKEHTRAGQGYFMRQYYRFDKQRASAIQEYLGI